MPTETARPSRRTFVPANVKHALSRAGGSLTAAASFVSDAAKNGLAEASERGGVGLRVEIFRREAILRPLCGAAIFFDRVFLSTEMSRKHVAAFPHTPEGALREPMAILNLIMENPHNAVLANLLDGRQLTNVIVGLSGADFVRVCYVLTRIDNAGARADSIRLNLLIKTPGCTTDSLLVRSRQCAWGDARELSFYSRYRELQATTAAAEPSTAKVVQTFTDGVDFCAVCYRSEKWRGMLVPVCVPKPLVSCANMWVGKQLLVLCGGQENRYQTFHDWTGFTYTQCRLVVTRAARFQAANWRPNSQVALFVHHRGGYEFLSYAKALQSKHQSQYFAPLQSALRAFIRKYRAAPLDPSEEIPHTSSAVCADPACKTIPLALCHGDLRPATVQFENAFVRSVTGAGLSKDTKPFDRAPATAGAAADDASGNPTASRPANFMSPVEESADDPRSPSEMKRTMTSFFDALPEDSLLIGNWGRVGVAPFLWDFTYCTVLGLSVRDRRRFQGTLLHDYLRELVDNGCLPPHELPHIEVCKSWVQVLTLAMVLVVWALQQTNLLHENDEVVRAANLDTRDERALRVTAAAVDVLVDTGAISKFMECDEALLKGMKTEIHLFGIA